MALSNSEYDEIMRTYENRQYDNELNLRARRAEVYEAVPAVKELDEKVASYSIAQAKARILGDYSKKGQSQKDLSLLFAQKRKLLIDAGYPANYLELQYTCPDCKDTGYIGTEKCHCLKNAIISLLYQQSNMQDILARENFQTFSKSYYSPHHIDPRTGKSARETIEYALSYCLNFVRNFDKQFDNLFLYGNTGVGKSFLSHCIAKEILDSSYSIIYFSSSQLFELIADKAFHRQGDFASESLSYIYDCDLLIIDDLGSEMINSFTNSSLFTLINERILHKKSTIISTNLSLEDVKSLYSERIFSRISSQYKMLRITGDDIRIQKKLLISGGKTYGSS